jgi:signal transduction histidine kinase
MGPLFAYSLVPVLSVAFLLGFTALLRGRNALGLSLYCLSVGLWAGTLLLMYLPETAPFGRRVAALGAFTAAGYLHAAYDVAEQRSYRLVWLAYAIALAITLAGAAWPGLLYDPSTLHRGPFFWPAMALAMGAAGFPMLKLGLLYPAAPPEQRRALTRLIIAGLLAYSGSLGNALLLSSGIAIPIGMYLVLAGLLVLANVIRTRETAGERRLLERSLLYSALAAFLSAGFLFGVMSLMASNTPFLTQFKVGAFFLLCMAALAFEPVRQQLQGWLGKRLFKDKADIGDLARELAAQEERADQAGRLAELGRFASAVAHEVRNPLGVLSAHLKLLERGGAAPETTAAMREQIERASHFVDELLRYGRPRPLELRMVDLGAIADLAFSTARQGLGSDAPAVELERASAPTAPLVEVDQAQISQVLVILFENALLALRDAPTRRLRVEIAPHGDKIALAVEDSGPGIPSELLPRLFQPFVTGRKREGPRPGTGLGLAIARGIAERHGGTVTAGTSALGGARFDIELPRYQAVLGAAAGHSREGA